jgi:hypothetical protein
VFVVVVVVMVALACQGYWDNLELGIVGFQLG